MSCFRAHVSLVPMHQNGQRAVVEVEAHLRDEISARIAQRIDHFLSLPDRINQINEDAYRMGRLNLADTELSAEITGRAQRRPPARPVVDPVPSEHQP